MHKPRCRLAVSRTRARVAGRTILLLYFIFSCFVIPLHSYKHTRSRYVVMTNTAPVENWFCNFEADTPNSSDRRTWHVNVIMWIYKTLCQVVLDHLLCLREFS